MPQYFLRDSFESLNGNMINTPKVLITLIYGHYKRDVLLHTYAISLNDMNNLKENGNTVIEYFAIVVEGFKYVPINNYQ